MKDRRFELKRYPCPLCGSAGRTLAMRKRGVVVDRDFDIVKCDICGHHRVDPRIADEDLDDLYDDAYFRAGGFDRNVNYFAPPSDYSRRVASDVVATVEEVLDRSLRGARWLDFGCGPGHLLEALRDQGVEGIGYDGSAAAAAICRARRLPIVSKDALSSQAGTFDVVSAAEVIEHVGDPPGFLRYLVSLLRIGGILYIQTGNWNIIRHIPGTPYIMPEGHIQYFTPSGMRKLFRRCGLQEVTGLNRSWFVYRDGPSVIRRFIPGGALRWLASTARAVVPAYASYPVGRRVA